MKLLKAKAWMMIAITGWLAGCTGEGPAMTDNSKELNYCITQLSKTVSALHDTTHIPRSIAQGQQQWRFVDYRDWTSGFFPGILWYAYEYTHDDKWKQAAQRFSAALLPLADSAAIDHDLGFQVYCSLGNGYRLTHAPQYKNFLLKTADSLSKLYNPKVGTILSWPREVPGTGWPLYHNTIMDNMINLELLFWAANNGGSRRLYDIAVSHAVTTMKNHFRPDYSSYHVVVYDTATGQKVKGITHQGYSDSSMWARGQAWAIYGFTMVARETKNARFLDFAQKVSDIYLERLPENGIPYWDFNAPGIPNEPRDASAAAIVASALLELSTLVPDTVKAQHYRQQADHMLVSLSSAGYQSRNLNDAFLLHSTGHQPNGGEIDASIIYADYYYIEALLRQRLLQEGGNKS
ncbi:glycoside hydrolase family 88 protein [Paraflavitalea speifideaquila]|uniref:glycoside hydrolase family 88 protein n=1 Tax=Paraflavitalea speifideaquila TaxID=3076558 RepID=UPI0028F16D3D|nr:glycoside hydrolase family 88 protein [Paraflavitalea speifideiaquila]